MVDKPKWAWSSVDDPNPVYPRCHSCDAFALWSVGRYEMPNPTGRGDWVIRWFACGRHLSSILHHSGEYELMVYDITSPPERG